MGIVENLSTQQNIPSDSHVMIPSRAFVPFIFYFYQSLVVFVYAILFSHLMVM